MLSSLVLISALAAPPSFDQLPRAEMLSLFSRANQAAAEMAEMSGDDALGFVDGVFLLAASPTVEQYLEFKTDFPKGAAFAVLAMSNGNVEQMTLDVSSGEDSSYGAKKSADGEAFIEFESNSDNTHTISLVVDRVVDIDAANHVVVVIMMYDGWQAFDGALRDAGISLFEGAEQKIPESRPNSRSWWLYGSVVEPEVKLVLTDLMLPSHPLLTAAGDSPSASLELVAYDSADSQSEELFSKNSRPFLDLGDWTAAKTTVSLEVSSEDPVLSLVAVLQDSAR